MNAMMQDSSWAEARSVPRQLLQLRWSYICPLAAVAAELRLHLSLGSCIADEFRLHLFPGSCIAAELTHSHLTEHGCLTAGLDHNHAWLPLLPWTGPYSITPSCHPLDNAPLTTSCPPNGLGPLKRVCSPTGLGPIHGWCTIPITIVRYKVIKDTKR